MRIAVLFAAFSLVAQVAAADPRATVWVRNPASVRGILPADQFKILDADSAQAERSKSGYLTPLKRNAVFHRLEMEEWVNGWDAVDKDILVLSSKGEDLALLKKQYPAIPEKVLRRLQQEVRELAKK